MTSIQRRWILTQVSRIISDYNKIDKLTEQEQVELVGNLECIAKKTKNNKECVRLVTDIAALFADKEQEYE